MLSLILDPTGKKRREGATKGCLLLKTLVWCGRSQMGKVRGIWVPIACSITPLQLIVLVFVVEKDVMDVALGEGVGKVTNHDCCGRMGRVSPR